MLAADHCRGIRAGRWFEVRLCRLAMGTVAWGSLLGVAAAQAAAVPSGTLAGPWTRASGAPVIAPQAAACNQLIGSVAPARTSPHLISCTPDGTVTRLDPATGRPMWTYQGPPGNVNHDAAAQPDVYFLRRRTGPPCCIDDSCI